MMKLYYKPGACSMASHIALAEAGETFDIEKADTAAGVTETGEDFKDISPNGYVPALKMGNGKVLFEGVAIMQYVADQHPDSHLAPKNGTMERYKLQEWLNFITSELHKGIGMFFSDKLTGDYKEFRMKKLHERLAYVENHFKTQKSDFLMGKDFGVADGYLFTVLRWTKPTNVSLEAYPHLRAFIDRVAARPAVKQVMAAEGIA